MGKQRNSGNEETIKTFLNKRHEAQGRSTPYTKKGVYGKERIEI